MDTVMSDEKLRSIFDLVVREVTEKLAGIRLYEGSAAPVGKDSCTVHATFARGFSSSLALCADTAMFIRLTQSMLQEEKVVVVPGTAFGDCGEGFLRISYAYSLDSLKEALDRMEAFLTKLRK